MSRAQFIFAILAACVWLSTADMAAAQLATERVASGLNLPNFVTAPAADGERLFIVEQRGRILLLKNGTLLPQPFLDIDPLVVNLTSFFDERGLLGLAFHPEYDTNGYFFVNYIDNSSDTVIARYTVSANPDSADAQSAEIILTVDQPRTNHNGGTLAFSPHDGYLYIGMGDSGGVGDPDNLAQSDSSLLGKMLRIDVDQGLPYTIPLDNPFAGAGAPLDEIWAKGLRNPYRWSFDSANGDLYIADVGQFDWEEIDYQPFDSPGGENYGWRLMEGNHCYEPPGGCNDGSLVLPVHEYSHDLGCSVSGGHVYRGAAIPWLQGRYFFGDWCTARIWSFAVVDGGVTEFTEHTEDLAPGGGMSISRVAAFGVDGLGELYIVDRSAENQGEIYKIVDDPTTIDEDSAESPPARFSLAQNYPNPFNPQTTIPFHLPAAQSVQLKIFAQDGTCIRALVAAQLPAGPHQAVWDGRDASGRPVASGTYVYRLEAGGRRTSRSMVLLK